MAACLLACCVDVCIPASLPPVKQQAVHKEEAGLQTCCLREEGKAREGAVWPFVVSSPTGNDDRRRRKRRKEGEVGELLLALLLGRGHKKRREEREKLEKWLEREGRRL